MCFSKCIFWYFVSKYKELWQAPDSSLYGGGRRINNILLFERILCHICYSTQYVRGGMHMRAILRAVTATFSTVVTQLNKQYWSRILCVFRWKCDYIFYSLRWVRLFLKRPQETSAFLAWTKTTVAGWTLTNIWSAWKPMMMMKARVRNGFKLTALSAPQNGLIIGRTKSETVLSQV